MLTAAQVQSARATLGVTPAPTTAPTDLSSKLASAWGTAPATPVAPSTPTEPGYVSRVGTDISSAFNEMGGKVATQAAQPGVPSVGQEIKTGLGVAKGLTSMAAAPITEAPGMKQLSDLFNAIGKPISDTLMQNPTYSATMTKLAGVLDQHPEIGDALTTAANVATIGGAKELVTSGAGAISDLKSGIQGVNAVHDAISNTLESTKPPEPPAGSTSLADQIRTTLAKGNVDPRLQTSATRLADPVKAYSDYATQAKQSMTDVKSDTPLATVGENIGNAYDNVIQTRRSVGAQMASELAKVKDTPVDISAPKAKFVDELSAGVGKMTSFDKQLVGQYNSELRALGNNPTAAQLDEFLSRVPNELNVTKAAKNITDVTNAERIIKGNLAQIRSSLTSQPGMEAYASARNSYSNLSNFLDEGSRYLGGKTQAGDYTRDASVAKSSAESILSGGKKDWLAKLESLTGYPALDDAVLAIQAMKDAGDTRGLSLFKSLSSGGGIPTPTGLFGKLLGWGASKAAGAIIGSPAEQTTAFLKNLKATAPK